MTIKNRLRFSAILLVVLILLTGLILFSGYHSVKHCAVMSEGLDKESLYLEKLLRGLNEIIINEGTPVSINTVKKAQNDFDTINLHLLSMTRNSWVREKLNHMSEEFNNIKKRAEPLLAHQYLDSDDDTLISYGALITRTEHLINESNSLSDSIKARLHYRLKVVIFGILLTLFAGITGIGIYLFKVYQSIMTPIKGLLSIADGFNRGDLNVMMDESRSDEFGSLARIFNSSVKKLNQTTQKVNERTKYLQKVINSLKTKTAEHKHAKEQIALAKQDWEDTFNTITDMITVHDKEFNIIRANKAAQEMLELPELNVNGAMKCYTYYHGTDCPSETCTISDAINTMKPVTFEILEPHLNKFIEVTAIPRIVKDNEFGGVIHVVRDISKRKQDEKLIQTQLSRLDALRSIDKAILGSIDMRVIIDIFLDQVMRQLHTDAASILLLNRKSQMLEYFYSKGFRSNVLKHTKLRLGEGNAGRAVVERNTIFIPNLKENLHGFEKSRDIEHESFMSYCAVPLIAKGEVKGVLEVFHRSELPADADWLEFLEAIADQGAIAIDNSTMFDNLQRSNIELTIAYDNTIEGWSRAMDLKDKETEGHSRRVTDMTVRIAHDMGINDENLVHIRRGALLHDLGKLGIPDSILLKPGKLNDEEWVIMKKHPEYAREMLYQIEYLRPALNVPYCHHEKWDGTGYPQGLQGEDIPIAARIFAIVDVWDALCSDRPYRPAWPKEKIIEHIRSLSGTHFDPEVVNVFFQVYEEVTSGELSESPDMAQIN